MQQTARKVLATKAKTYYSSEALNPRPKRGRPPKQTAKLDIEPQVSVDIYTQVSAVVRPFLFIPDISSATGATFSSKFESEGDLLATRRLQMDMDRDLTLENLNKKLASLRDLSGKLVEKGIPVPLNGTIAVKSSDLSLFESLGDEDEDDEDEDLSFDEDSDKVSAKPSKGKAKATPPKKAAAAPVKKAQTPSSAAKKPAVAKKAAPKPAAAKPASPKKAPSKPAKGTA